ncbi:MAG: LTA synthase family protein [Bacteroidia bacterium]|nr:LTA synthase family protein [Bacteroidia bacterium]
MFLYQISRLVFGLTNPGTYTGELIPVFLAGLRYDLTAICIINLPFIAVHLYPGKYSYTSWFQGSVSAYFILINSIALLFNFVDAGWYPYIQKRSTFDVFSLVTTGNDVRNNIGQYLLDFWYLLLAWILCIIVLVYAEKSIRKHISMFSKEAIRFPSLPLRISTALLLLVLTTIGFRGGLQLKPLSIQAAAKMVPSSSIPLVLNTPYCLLKSMDDQLLEEPTFMPLGEAEKHFRLHRSHHPPVNFQAKNVILVIMESFSWEYISFYHPGKKTTPFLDSLMSVSACWPNCFANAKRSIEGIPAIVASFPALMDQSFINSAYNISKINSLARLLQPFGYTSGFFHGGNNGTMGFDNFSKLAGYQKYFGRNEYDGPPSDYDGHWGIFDHAYFSFMIRTLNTWTPPFHSIFFSVSSHHPYTLPAGFQQAAPAELSPVEKGTWYADASLRLFFQEAAKQVWYKNTLFIITADHSGPAGTPYSSNRLGAYHIPLIFYMPDTSMGAVHAETAQQTDILPSALHLLHYRGSVSAFGRNLFEGEKGWSLNYANNTWEIITDSYVLQHDGHEAGHFFNRKDSLLRHNLKGMNIPEEDTLTVFLKAILQQYQHGLIHNQLVKQ